MDKPAHPSQALARRYVKAVLEAGATFAELRVEPDGTIRVFAAPAGGNVSENGANPWNEVLR